MTVILAFLILSAPFGLAAVLSWASHRHDALRGHLVNQFGDPDWYRVQHDADAARTRFEHAPSWPASGVMGERR
ncbi:MAG: hypothetical protein QOE74_5929 [Mycobacterium sp.]|jgi:hypothetical protein|nr:hypothetical protein [Mycobacterium sp.]